MRLDVYLPQSGLVKSRSSASRLISDGHVTVDGRVITKPSYDVGGNEDIVITCEMPFVSRAGEKLKHALDAFGVNAAGKTVLDIGASTGGFTDCLLKNGAGYVYALDVGSGQLDAGLRNDLRVCVMENFNARDAKKSDFDRPIDMVTMDVSFISQSLIYPAIADILPVGGELVTLVKPQFEVGRTNIGKGGIVKDPDKKLIAEVMERLGHEAGRLGLTKKGFTDSPILGGDGNCEYLAYFIKTKE